MAFESNLNSPWHNVNPKKQFRSPHKIRHHQWKLDPCYLFLLSVRTFILIVRSNAVLQLSTSSNTRLHSTTRFPYVICLGGQVNKMVLKFTNNTNINGFWIFVRYWTFWVWLDSPHCRWFACLLHSVFKTLTLRIIDRIGLILKLMLTSVKGFWWRKCWGYILGKKS